MISTFAESDSGQLRLHSPTVPVRKALLHFANVAGSADHE